MARTTQILRERSNLLSGNHFEEAQEPRNSKEHGDPTPISNSMSQISEKPDTFSQQSSDQTNKRKRGDIPRGRERSKRLRRAPVSYAEPEDSDDSAFCESDEDGEGIVTRKVNNDCAFLFSNTEFLTLVLNRSRNRRKTGPSPSARSSPFSLSRASSATSYTTTLSAARPQSQRPMRSRSPTRVTRPTETTKLMETTKPTKATRPTRAMRPMKPTKPATTPPQPPPPAPPPPTSSA